MVRQGITSTAADLGRDERLETTTAVFASTKKAARIFVLFSEIGGVTSIQFRIPSVVRRILLFSGRIKGVEYTAHPVFVSNILSWAKSEFANVCVVAEMVGEDRGEGRGEGVRGDGWIGLPKDGAVGDCAGSR